MKKKVLAIALAVALLAIMVGGSLAYFTDTDQVTNTFTVGSVLIDIYENGAITDKDVIEFDKPLTPVVNTTPSADESYIPKTIKVQSNGENAAYIRTLIAIPKNLVDYLILDTDTTNGWTKLNETLEVTVESVTYVVYLFDYANKVAPDAFTPDVLKGVYLASDVDLEADTNGSLWFVKKNYSNGKITHSSGFLAHTKGTDGYTTNTISVLVAAQAIQAQGFSNATDALNTGFPVGTNPWGTATLNP